jgi:hypothetical protein
MTITRTTLLATLALVAVPALANPVQGTYSDVASCDNHGLWNAKEEIGTGPLFPTPCLMTAIETFTQQSACFATDDPNRINSLVVATNLSGRFWHDLFYVADLETTFSNVDGVADSAATPGAIGLAVKIDAVGSNRPLVFESMTADGIFEPGETWHFILQDFSNAYGLGADLMGSLDFAGSSFGDSHSTGSLVSFNPVPAPGAVALLGLGGLAAARRRRFA